MDSILETIKNDVGICDESEFFDSQIIDNANSIFVVLSQMGIGSKTAFQIKDRDQVWTDFLPEGNLLTLAKQYVGLRVKQLFDPSTSSSVIEAIQTRIDELEWRLLEEKEIIEKMEDNEEDLSDAE